jgi:hypothetical protein
MRVACDHCNKKFRSEGAMRMHEKAAHPHKLVNRVQTIRREGKVKAFFLGFGSGAAAIAACFLALVVTAQVQGQKAGPIVKAAYEAVAWR